MNSERPEERDDATPRSRFSDRWVPLLFGLVALALILVIALPYLLDWWSPAPSGPPAVLKREPAPPLRPPATETTPPSPTPTPPPRAEKRQTQAGSPAPSAAKQVTKPAPAPAAKQAKEDEAPRPSARGGYLVQVGAFQDATNAARLAAQLAREKYPVRRGTQSRPQSGGTGHEVLVIGASTEEVNGKLRGATYRAHATPEGVLIQPALPLKEAVSLSQELRADGLNVKIRRAQGAATLHTVSVGAYPNRSRAEAVRKELQEKGFSGFVVGGTGR